MIYVKRPKTAPPVFNAAIMKKARKEILDFYKLSHQDRSQQKLPYVQLTATVLKQLRKELDKLFNGKCAYCESPVGDITYGDFDHFRPRTSSRGLNNEFSAMHYGWLAYTWPNMYLSCQECNKHKINWFPVELKSSRSAPLTPYLRVISEEKALFVDPCNDQPQEHFDFKADGSVIPRTKKGETTVELLNLNRRGLVESRRKVMEILNAELSFIKSRSSQLSEKGNARYRYSVNNFLDTLSGLASNKGSFIAAQRSLITAWLNQEVGIRDLIFTGKSDEALNSSFVKSVLQVRVALKSHLSKFYAPPVMKAASKAIKRPIQDRQTARKSVKITTRINLDRIELKNFKAIEALTIKFPESNSKLESWLMFLGENGVGKSTMLQAITLTLMGGDYFSKLKPKPKPKDLLRHETHDGYVKIFTKESDQPVEMSFSLKQSRVLHSHKTAPSFLLGYGSTRLFKTGTFREEPSKGLVKAMNMFDPSYALTDAAKWILQITDEELFDKVAIAIKDLLLFSNKERLVRENGKVYVHYKHKPPDTLNELSDGYKSVIAVTVDIMKTLVNANTTMEAAEGIVLLDEIGTHLHPRWKMEVVKRFRNVFPRLQFIVTTHDPLCLKGLKKGEVAVFNRDEHHKVYVQTDLPDPAGFRADQLLSSEFFGLKSTISMKEEEDFNKYYELLRKKDRLTPAEQKRLERLKKTLQIKRHLGNSLREELAFDAVDELLAREESNNNALNRDKLKESTVNMVQEIWKDITKKDLQQ